MQSDAYYSLIGFVAFFVLVIVNYQIFFNEENNEVSAYRGYRKFLVAVLFYYFFDAAWGIFNGTKIIYLLYADTVAYYIAMGFSVVLWCSYVREFLKLDDKVGKLLNTFGYLFCAGEILLLIVNHFVRVFFLIDADGNYHPCAGRYVVLTIQIFLYVFIAIQSMIVSIRSEQRLKKRNITIALYGVAMVITVLIQAIYPLLPIYTIGLLIGTCLVHVFVVEDQKEEFKVALQGKQVRLEESTCEQEAQIEEITELNEQLQQSQEKLETRLNIIETMSSTYFISYYIDLKQDTFIELSAKENVHEVVKAMGKAQASLNMACETLIAKEHTESMLEFYDLSTINERLRDRNEINIEYVGVTTGWSEAYIIAGDRDYDGNLLHIFIAARMIHDRKDRETEQVKVLEEYNNIIANAGLGIWHIYIEDGKKPRMTVNKKMRKLLGIKDKKKSPEGIYEHWYSRINEEAIPSVSKSVEEMIRGKFSENTYLWNHPTLGEIYVRCGGTAEKLGENSYVLRGYHYDVTEIVIGEQEQKKELAKAKYAAECANNAKSTFLFNMSHDIRTPMNAIIGFSNLLEKNLDNHDAAVDYLQKIQHSSAFLLSLINNVLEMARIESGKITVDETLCKVGDISKDVRTIFEERMKQKNIEFIFEIEAQTKYIYVDSVKLNEIFLNLVSNAYKYTPEGGKVAVRIKEVPCEKEGYAGYEVKVSDTGIGMSKEFLPHIFEEFSREKNATETKEAGTGLGMPIVKKLIELEGGTISVESELGKGTTFTVNIAHRIGVAEDDKQNEEVEIDYSVFAEKRILLAEDNDLNAEIAIEFLKSAGFEVDRAEDGLLCLNKLKNAEENYYNLILMDIQMPNMDGYTATQEIRKLEKPWMANIPIIAMTANAFDEDKKNAFESGMNGHLAKPVNPEVLMKTLAEILS